MIRHLAGCWRLGRRLHRVRDRKGLGCDWRIGADLLISEPGYLDVVDTVGQRVRDLHATDGFPVCQHEIKVRIAIDVVVIACADGSGQMSFGIEQYDECRWAVSV